MKTRIIHTKVWKDTWYVSLEREAKYLWLYLLTNEKINISGIYELSDREILFDTSINQQDLEKIKSSLSPKAVFFDGWVKICNVERYNKYRNSPLNQVAYKNELSYVPLLVKDKFEIENDTSIDTSIYTPINKEQGTINNKLGIENLKQEIRSKIKSF